MFVHHHFPLTHPSEHTTPPLVVRTAGLIASFPNGSLCVPSLLHAPAMAASVDSSGSPEQVLVPMPVSSPDNTTGTSAVPGGDSSFAILPIVPVTISPLQPSSVGPLTAAFALSPSPSPCPSLALPPSPSSALAEDGFGPPSAEWASSATSLPSIPAVSVDPFAEAVVDIAALAAITPHSFDAFPMPQPHPHPGAPTAAGDASATRLKRKKKKKAKNGAGHGATVLPDSYAVAASSTSLVAPSSSVTSMSLPPTSHWQLW